MCRAPTRPRDFHDRQGQFGGDSLIRFPLRCRQATTVNSPGSSSGPMGVGSMRIAPVSAFVPDKRPPNTASARSFGGLGDTHRQREPVQMGQLLTGRSRPIASGRPRAKRFSPLRWVMVGSATGMGGAASHAVPVSPRSRRDRPEETPATGRA